MQVCNSTMKTQPVPARALSRALSRAFSSSSTSPAPPFPLKTVIKSNFETSFADLRRHVRACDFVAIDLEMTGITSAPWRESFEFDRSDIRYLKVKDSADNFAVVQVGVCPFRWDSSKQSFVAHPYNFYVFPRQELQNFCPSHEFLCQTTSVDFLVKYQFDFNMCIREGISYLSKEQENEALRSLSSTYCGDSLNTWCKLMDDREMPLTRLVDILFVERLKLKLREWRDGLLQNRNGEVQLQRASNVSKEQIQVVFYKMRPSLSLNGFTSRQLDLIQLVIRKHFKDLAYVSVNGKISSLQQLIVYTESQDDLNLLMKEVRDEHRRVAEMKIQTAVGFRHVIDLLSSEQKLLVGHNCFLDFAQIYRKFIGSLPSSADEYVSSINKCFAHIIDTKLLLNLDSGLHLMMRRSRTTLSSAFTLLCPEIAVSSSSTGAASCSSVKVEVQVDDFRSSSWNPGAKHEAGYDAFMTGCVFIKACHHLGIDFKAHQPSDNLAFNQRLQKYINLLYLSWKNGDIVNLTNGEKIAATSHSSNFKKQYPKILFDHIVLIWGFPCKLKANEIRECISKVFGPGSVVSVYHLDETAVFVQFSKTEYVSDFLLLKDSLEKANDAISVLHPLTKLLEGGNTCAANYDTYKEICASPVSEVLFADQAKAALGNKWKTKLGKAVALESQEQVEPLEEVHTGQEYPQKIEHMTIDKLKGDLCGNVSCDEIIDSICATAEVHQSRVPNM